MITSRTSPVRRLAKVFAVAAVLALAAGAPAADDDFEFAQALAKRGYTDLAEKTYRSLIQDPRAPAPRKAEGQLGLALLKYTEAGLAAAEESARRRKPFEEVMGLFDSAEGEIAGFIKKNPSHERLLDAKLERARLLQDKAKYIKKAMENGWVPSDVSRNLKEEMAKGFDVAIEMLEAVEKRARDDYAAAEGDEDRAEAEYELGRVWLLRLYAMYGKGEALPKGNADGQAALEQALSEITEDFMWDFEGRVLGIWAMHFAGLISRELDNPRDATDFLRTAAGYVDEAEAPPAARDVTLLSYVELSKTAIHFIDRDGNWVQDSLKFFGDLQKRWPNHLRWPQGQRAALAHAKLLHEAGRNQAAISMVQEVIGAATKTSSGVDFEAGNILSHFMTDGGGEAGADLDPGLIRRVADSKFRSGEVKQAIGAFQAVIRACRTDEQMETFGWEAWDFVGRCYSTLGRHYASFVAWDTIEDAWKKNRANPKLTEITDETGWYRARALDYVARATKDPADVAAAKAALDAFTRDHPNSPYNLGAEEKNAVSKYTEGKRTLRDDAEKGTALIRQAIGLMEAIKDTSKLYDKIQAMIAEAYLEIGEYDKGQGQARTWLSTKRKEAMDSSVLRARAEGRSIALTVVLRALIRKAESLEAGQARRDAYRAVLTGLDEYGADFAKAVGDGERIVLVWRAESFIEVGETDKGEALVWDVLKRWPDNRNGPYLAGITARSVARAAEEWRAKGDEGRYRSYMLRAARLREFVLDRSDPRKPDVIVYVGRSYADGGDFEKATELYNEALSSLLASKATTSDPDRVAALEDKIGSVKIALIDLLVDQGKFDEAIPLLETRLVEDETDRAEVMGRLFKDTNLTTADLDRILPKTSKSKAVMVSLSKAWLKAKNKERLIGSINLCAILLYTTPKDDHHKADHISHWLRQMEAFLQFGLDERSAPAFDTVIKQVQNRFTLGMEDQYDAELAGSKKRMQKLIEQAKSERSKMR